MKTASPLIKEKPKYWQPFFMAFIMTAVVFAPFVIMDHGYFLFYGDFNVQQIPFYQMCHDAVRNGNIFWNWTTDLGVNFIGSYSFYLLGSPFFWLTIPFPSHIVPYLMAPLFCLKFACATLTSYAFIRRFTKTNESAIVGSLLYSFSGFSIVNIFFNHFHEPLVFFPLLLIGVEELMQKRRVGVFALTVAINCIVNYFFFGSMVTFTIVYFIVKSVSGGWEFKFGKFVKLAFEAVLGVLLAMFILMPSLLSVIQNPRVDNMYYGYSALFYGYQQRYGQIIYSLFFPPDLPACNNFFTGSETKWASVSAWLPLFGMTGVIAFIKAKRGHWAKRLFIVCAVMALVPVFNSAFFMFNSAYYGRWFFMIVLIMCMMTAVSLEDDKANWNSGILWSFTMIAAISLFIGLYPQRIQESEENPSGIKYGLYDDFWNFIVWVAISLLLLLFTVLLIKAIKKRYSKETFMRITLVSTCFVCVIWSIIFLGFGKTVFNHNHESFMIPYCLNQGVDINLPDQGDENYRIDVLDGEGSGYDNQGMFWQMRSIQSFHSIIPGSSMEFYPSVGVTRDVGTRPEADLYELRSLLSVRWLFNYQDDSTDPVMPGYTYYDWQNGYYVSRNDNYIPMGFTYDYYITEEDYYGESENNRAALLLKAVLLKDEDIPKYEGILQHLDMDTVSYDYDSFVLDCQSRNEQTADYIKIDNHGFDSKITLSSDELVFFSVPYEKGKLYDIDMLYDEGISNLDGWTCKVDGKRVNINNVNVGFMGINLTAGEHTIRFDYRTPGLYLGIAISLGALAVFVLYVIIMLIAKRSRKNRYYTPAFDFEDDEEQGENNAESDEIEKKLTDLEDEKAVSEQTAEKKETPEQSDAEKEEETAAPIIEDEKSIIELTEKAAENAALKKAEDKPLIKEAEQKSSAESDEKKQADEKAEQPIEDIFIGGSMKKKHSTDWMNESVNLSQTRRHIEQPEDDAMKKAEDETDISNLNVIDPKKVDEEIKPVLSGDKLSDTGEKSDDPFDFLNASIDDLLKQLNINFPDLNIGEGNGSDRKQ